MKLRVINTNTIDPYLNCSLEKILQEKCISTNELIIRFWRNDKSVIMGRTQNIEKEVNLAFCNENNIKIVKIFGIFSDYSVNYKMIHSPLRYVRQWWSFS